MKPHRFHYWVLLGSARMGQCHVPLRICPDWQLALFVAYCNPTLLREASLSCFAPCFGSRMLVHAYIYSRFPMPPHHRPPFDLLILQFFPDLLVNPPTSPTHLNS